MNPNTWFLVAVMISVATAIVFFRPLAPVKKWVLSALKKTSAPTSPASVTEIREKTLIEKLAAEINATPETFATKVAEIVGENEAAKFHVKRLATQLGLPDTATAATVDAELKARLKLAEGTASILQALATMVKAPVADAAAAVKLIETLDERSKRFVWDIAAANRSWVPLATNHRNLFDNDCEVLLRLNNEHLGSAKVIADQKTYIHEIRDESLRYKKQAEDLNAVNTAQTETIIDLRKRIPAEVMAVTEADAKRHATEDGKIAQAVGAVHKEHADKVFTLLGQQRGNNAPRHNQPRSQQGQPQPQPT